MQFSFASKFRIKTEDQIKHILKRGRRITAAEFALIFCVNELTHPRLCVIVGKKNVRRANRRNTFKRVMREYFRIHQADLNGIDIIILANRKANELTKKELHQCIEKQWQKLIGSLKKSV